MEWVGNKGENISSVPGNESLMVTPRSKFKFKVAFTNYCGDNGEWTGAGSAVSICEDKSRSLNDDAIIIALTFLITRTTELDIDPFVRPETRLITWRGELCVTSQIKFVSVVIRESV